MSAISPTYDLVDVVELEGLAKAKAFARSVPFGVWLATLVLLVFVVAAVFPTLLESQDPLAVNLTQTLKTPSWSHLLGTDQLGRDLFSRVVAGTRESLLIGFGATGLSLLAATALGLAAGIGGKVGDALVSRFLEVLFAFPVLFLALLVVAVFKAKLSTEIIAIALGTAAGHARMIRGQVLAVRDAPYVEAAKAVGHPYPRVIRQHILPNALRPLVALFTLGVGSSVVWASGLSFLGLGVPPPSSEWGALLNAGQPYITNSWWLEVMPGVAIVLLALSVTVIGRHVQERLEGRVKTGGTL